MKPWFSCVPPWLFSIGRFLYLEELLGLCSFGLTSGIIWVVVASTDLSPTTGQILTIVAAIFWASLSIWPRASDVWTANATVKSLISNPFSAPCEILRGKVSIDEGGAFRDPEGRRIFLRGVNLSGSTKLPPGIASSDPQKIASFIGKPFPLKEADEHLSRLRSAGFTFLRLLITWEAVEPRAQGDYDRMYLEYLTQVVRACGRHGISVVIDPHQDVWSRWTGGDGAPRWTLDRLGFDVDNFWACRAAILHSHCPDLPKMSWSTNYMLYATATMFSLFFAGNDLVSNTVGSQRVQDWLQDSFVAAMVEVATVLRGEPNVIGFEALNEPNAGWVGRWSEDRPLTNYEAGLPLGWMISPWESILCANGGSMRAAVFAAPMVYSHTETVNPDRCSVWKEGVRDIWAENGLWDDTTRTLLRPDFFKIADPDPHEPFQNRYMVPFWAKFGAAIHAVMPDALIFTGPPVELEAPAHIERLDPVTAETVDTVAGTHQPGQVLFPGKQVWSPHWYDGLTLISSRFRGWLGVDDKGLRLGPWAQPARTRGVRAVLSHREKMPSMVGEVGVPWMGAGGMTGRAMLATMRALEEAQPDAVTLWNYTPDHDGRDDGWNREDLSIWSGVWRMPEAIQPHVKRLSAGATDMKSQYKPRKRVFTVSFVGGRAGSATEIFVPFVHFPTGVSWSTSNGDSAEFYQDTQTVRFVLGADFRGRRHRIKIVPEPEPQVRSLESISIQTSGPGLPAHIPTVTVSSE